MTSSVRVGHPLLSHVRLASDLAAMPWGGLMLRDARLRAFLPFAKPRVAPVEGRRGSSTGTFSGGTC